MRVKLVKGLSYTTSSFSCKKGMEVTVFDEVGKELIASGKFEEAGSAEPASDEAPAQEKDGADDSQQASNNNADGQELTAELIEKMKKAELEALAQEKEIDISECNNNEERVEKIKGALGLVNLNDIFGE